MTRRARTTLAVLLSGAALTAGTEPKKAAAEYPAHGSLSQVAIGAEYLVRSISGLGRTFFLNDHLVVEVAIFPVRGEKIELSSSQFTLRVGSKKEILYSQAPGFVRASLKYPDWERRRNIEAIAGAGGGGVIVGRPPSVERFPGDPRPGQTRLPAPPRAPENSARIERDEPVRVDKLVQDAALPEGEAVGAVSGYVFFPFKGRAKSVRPVELIYRGTAGSLTLRFP